MPGKSFLAAKPLLQDVIPRNDASTKVAMLFFLIGFGGAMLMTIRGGSAQQLAVPDSPVAMPAMGKLPQASSSQPVMRSWPAWTGSNIKPAPAWQPVLRGSRPFAFMQPTRAVSDDAAVPYLPAGDDMSRRNVLKAGGLGALAILTEAALTAGVAMAEEEAAAEAAPAEPEAAPTSAPVAKKVLKNTPPPPSAPKSAEERRQEAEAARLSRREREAALAEKRREAIAERKRNPPLVSGLGGRVEAESEGRAATLEAAKKKKKAQEAAVDKLAEFAAEAAAR